MRRPAAQLFCALGAKRHADALLPCSSPRLAPCSMVAVQTLVQGNSAGEFGAGAALSDGANVTFVASAFVGNGATDCTVSHSPLASPKDRSHEAAAGGSRRALWCRRPGLECNAIVYTQLPPGCPFHVHRCRAAVVCSLEQRPSPPAWSAAPGGQACRSPRCAWRACEWWATRRPTVAGVCTWWLAAWK